MLASQASATHWRLGPYINTRLPAAIALLAAALGGIVMSCLTSQLYSSPGAGAGEGCGPSRGSGVAEKGSGALDPAHAAGLPCKRNKAL